MKYAMIFMLVIGAALAADLYNTNVKGEAKVKVNSKSGSDESSDSGDKKHHKQQKKNFKKVMNIWDRFQKQMRDEHEKLKIKFHEKRLMFDETGRRYGMQMKQKLQRLYEKVNHALNEGRRRGAEKRDDIRHKLQEIYGQISMKIHEFSQRRDAFSQRIVAELNQKREEIMDRLKQFKIQIQVQHEEYERVLENVRHTFGTAAEKRVREIRDKIIKAYEELRIGNEERKREARQQLQVNVHKIQVMIVQFKQIKTKAAQQIAQYFIHVIEEIREEIEVENHDEVQTETQTIVIQTESQTVVIKTEIPPETTTVVQQNTKYDSSESESNESDSSSKEKKSKKLKNVKNYTKVKKSDKSD